MNRIGFLRAGPSDPRFYQVAALGSLLLYGVLGLGFEIRRDCLLATLGAALAAQYLATRLIRLPSFDPRSALITGLSLCLLLRTDSIGVAAGTAAAAIASKFAIRIRGKHIFNPANFGLVVALVLASHRAWVSAGQWGSAAFFGFLLACAGTLVVTRAARSDVTLSFLLFYGAILFGRAAWLDQPAAIPLHQLQNGALLIFAFFMISDPRTTPDSRRGRVLFALLAAAGAGIVQFILYRSNPLLWSLAAAALSVPAIDRWLPDKRDLWKVAGVPFVSKGASHAVAS